MGRTIGNIFYTLKSRLRTSFRIRQFKKSIKKKPPVIVYQMGKVGSSSIYNSLKESYSGITLHRHELNLVDDWQDQLLIKHGMFLKMPLKIITLTREPVARNISAFFQNFEYLTGIAPKNSTFSCEEISSIFLSNSKMDHTVPLWWFDKNILKNFGINVFAQAFPKDEGWVILKNGSVELLLMKAEINDKKKTLLVKRFLAMKEFELSSFNVGENKDYATMYSVFKKNSIIPSNYLDMLYNSIYMKHFYTEQEVEFARKNWKHSVN